MSLTKLTVAYPMEVILETYYTSKRNDRNGTPYYGDKPSSIYVQFCMSLTKLTVVEKVNHK
jgi:hypothetical protein